MKVHEEFTVTEPVGAVWMFFGEPESVASCMPGVEEVTVLDHDNVQVRATQSVGPMTATFEARVTVLERVTDELIRFRAAGQSVRGAIGNMRMENTVRMRGTAEGTSVLVDGDLVLAGALGSVGQKVVARQAGKVTAEFAANLQRALSGEGPALARSGTSREVPRGTSVQAGAGRTARWS
ncbi:MAG: CoxG family protein, partial [Streptosporangiaceae bacterium]